MGSFTERLQTMTGLTVGNAPCPAAERIRDLLNEGARDVVNKTIAMDPTAAVEFSVSQNSATNALPDSIPSRMVLEVSRENNATGSWRPCKEIPLVAISMANDSASLHEATKFSPVYYWEGQTIKVIPAIDDNTSNKARATYVGYPGISDIDGPFTTPAVSEKVLDLILMYGGFKTLEAALGYISAEGVPIDLDLADAPVTPVMEVVSEVIPEYNGPTNMVMPIAPEGVDISYGDLAAPDFTVPIAKPVVDVNIVFDKPAPVFIKPVMGELDWADTQNWIAVEEDTDLLAARISEIQAKMNEYSSLAQTSTASFTEENTKYQADLQVVLAQTKLDAQSNANAFQEFSNDLQGNTAKFQGELSIWKQDVTDILQKYQAETGYDLSRYSALLNAEVARVSNELQVASSDFQSRMTEYTTSVQDTSRVNQESLAIYGSAMQNHAANTQALVQEYTLKLQKDTTQYGWMQGQFIQLKQQYNEAFALNASKGGQ